MRGGAPRLLQRATARTLERTMDRIARTSALWAALFFAAAMIVGGSYYFYVRATFPGAEKQAAVARFIQDPKSPAEHVRKVALDSHETVIAAFEAIEAAAIVIVVLCLAAAGGFMSIVMDVRKAKKGASGAL